MNLYNTLSRRIEDFKPLEDKQVKMYTCGLTVYSQPQIGNWVAYIYADVLHRTLLAAGYEVNRVQNVTDVGHLTSDEDAGEDKMIKGALKEGTTAWEVAEKYIKIADHEAFDLLGLLKPTQMPRATDYIAQQIAFVEQLETKGLTYQIPDDGIYFDTSKFKNYDKLARLDIKGLRFGARVAATGKKNPTDFALWRFSPKNEKRDMEWESPWGKGFPGWHLECSVMARELLGDQIDIHSGGIDHIPVHHTNEIAQTESLTGKQFVKYWFHNNHLKVNGTKLSKSLGNSYTLQDILAKGYDLQAFKLLVLSSHYRTEGNFTWEIMEAAQNRLNNWLAAAELRWQESKAVNSSILGNEYESSIIDSLQNDLNSPQAIRLIDEAFEKINALHLCKPCIEIILVTIREVFGIDLAVQTPNISEEQKMQIKEREAARQAKDWAKSDDLRAQLERAGIALNDTPNGAIWSRIKKKD